MVMAALGFVPVATKQVIGFLVGLDEEFGGVDLGDWRVAVDGKV